jgi:hypothetical protein
MKDYEVSYRKWLEYHIAHSNGERRRRIKERHGFGEKLLVAQAWWPVMGSLEYLHPEYEFIALDGSHYFMDFGYLRKPRPTCLESDGFISHARDADRSTFSWGLDRQNDISLAEWNILRFSTDKLKEDPAGCQRSIRRMLEVWYGEDNEQVRQLPLYYREILRFAVSSTDPITVALVSERIGKGEKFARRLLHEMRNKGLLEPISGEQRIHSYRLKR